MTLFHKKPHLPSGANAVHTAQSINEKYPIQQGFQVSAVNGTTTTQKLTLTAPGEFLLGFANVPDSSTGSLFGILVTFQINNYSVFSNATANQYNNQVIHSFWFFEVIQKLTGNDNIQISYNNTTGTTQLIDVTLLYQPQ